MIRPNSSMSLKSAGNLNSTKNTTSNAVPGISVGDDDDRKSSESTIPARCLSYLKAVRPWSFSASFIPVVLGTVLAYKYTHTFSPVTFVLTCISVLLIHAAGNLVNTFYDFKNGIDNQKSDDRTLVDRMLNPIDVAGMGAVFYSLAMASFLLTVLSSSAKMEHLALIFFGGLSGSFLYTGGLAFKYLCLGDVVVLLTFGPIAVLFAYTAQSGSCAIYPLLYAFIFVMNTEAVLHSNNARDAEYDKKAGIRTLAMLLGKTGSYMTYCVLLFIPYVILIFFLANHSYHLGLPLVTLPLAFKLERLFRSHMLEKLPQETAKLNLGFGFMYVVAILICPSAELPWLS